MISRERVPGTVTAAVNRGKDGLQYAIQRGDVHFHQAHVEACVADDHDHDDHRPTKRRRLELSSGESIRGVDQVLLATGFGKQLPGGTLVRSLVQSDHFPVSDYCGYPVVDSSLRWGNKKKSNIFVMGALAELELGPSARNIAGARMAAERILSSLT